MVNIESNEMRRAHRIDIPIGIVIDSVVYKSKDWSMTGVSVENLQRTFEKDEIIDSAIVLKLREAKIEMPVQLQFKAQRGSVFGFEFHEISKKNKRVLREFLELSIEGKLESIDGLLSIYNEPVIESPVKESVVLSDEEESVLKRAFVKRSKLYLTLGVLFFILIIITIYYNNAYIYRSIGLVSGNFVKVTPGVSGTVGKIHVKKGDRVHPNTLLLELDDSMILKQIDIIDEKLKKLKYRIKNVSHSDVQLVQLLKNEKHKAYKAYRSAADLYKNHLINKNDFEKVKRTYINARVKYLQESGRSQRTAHSSTNASLLSLITELELKKEGLLNTLNHIRVFSHTDGIVYEIKPHIGNFVGSTDKIMVIETPVVPFVVCKVHKDEAPNIKKGMTVKVYSSTTNKTYSAHVDTIGNLALNPESIVTSEVSFQEVSVKIVFDEKNVHLPLNERVKVWFYRPLL